MTKNRAMLSGPDTFPSSIIYYDTGVIACLT
jgi:hypothetical protein